MDEPVFPDKSCKPTDADVAQVLGRAKQHWDNLTASALKAEPEAAPEWKFYMKRTGWTFLLRGKRRNVLYMRPIGKGRFTVSFVFSDKAVDAAEQSNLPAAVIKEMQQAKEYPEGRGVSVEVKNAADLKVATKLLAIKVAN